MGMHDDDDAFVKDLLGKVDGHIDDGGFTARVMTRLPPPAKTRQGIVAVTTGAACLMGLMVPQVRDAVTATCVELSSGIAHGSVGMASVMLLALVVWGAVSVGMSER